MLWRCHDLILAYLALHPIINGCGCEKPPEISLLIWVGSDGFSGQPDNYLKTSVSHDLDQAAPVTLVNGSTYILTSEVTLIAFMCKAPYPVEWEFSNAKWLLLQEKTFGLYLTTSRRISDDKDLKDDRAFKYWTELAMLGDSRMYVGSYTCKSSHPNDKLSSNFTMFWEGGPSDNVFVLSGKNVTIYIEKDNRLVLPCQVNNPFANIALSMDAGIVPGKNTTENWARIPIGPPSKWTYQPELGFIYTGDNNKVDDYPPVGSYKCILLDEQNQEDEESEDVVNINISYDMDPYANAQLFDAPIKTNATFAYNQKERQYECCSSSATPPRILIHSCCDPATCNELIPAMKTQLSSISSYSQMTSTMNQLYSPQLASIFNRKNGSCIYNSMWPSSAEMDFVQCIGDGISVVRKYMPRNTKNLTFDNWDSNHLRPWVTISAMSWKTPTFPVKQIWKGNNDTFQVFSGSTVVFRCRSSFYFFSYGIRFSTKNSAGVETTLPDTFETQARKKLANYKMLLLLHNPPLSAEINVTITHDIASLTCHVPVTNSSEWVKQTIYFSVKVAEKPTILDDESSEITSVVWTLNATNMILTCKTKGQPEPRIVWTKDNVPIGKLFNQTHHNQTHTLLIPQVTHDVQGQYRCTAMNFKGKSEKLFIVAVEENPVTHVWTIIMVIIAILAVLIGGGVLVHKTILQKKTLNNLREHVYPNGEGVQPNNDG